MSGTNISKLSENLQTLAEQVRKVKGFSENSDMIRKIICQNIIEDRGVEQSFSNTETLSDFLKKVEFVMSELWIDSEDLSLVESANLANALSSASISFSGFEDSTSSSWGNYFYDVVVTIEIGTVNLVIKSTLTEDITAQFPRKDLQGITFISFDGENVSELLSRELGREVNIQSKEMNRLVICAEGIINDYIVMMNCADTANKVTLPVGRDVLKAIESASFDKDTSEKTETTSKVKAFCPF